MVCLAQHFRVVVGMSMTTPILSLSTTTTTRRGYRSGKMPQGRSTDCNVARNYVSAVSTADIPPSRLFPALHAILRPSHMHPSATAAAGMHHAEAVLKKGHLSFPIFFSIAICDRWTILIHATFRCKYRAYIPFRDYTR